MTELVFPHLPNAPIFEATIELRVASASPFPDGAYGAFRERTADKYPLHSNMRFVAPRITLEDAAEVHAIVTTSVIGVRVESSDRRNVVHAKKDGLTVSRLAPYSSWDDLVAEARTLWPIYLELFRPVKVIRLGTRYINHIVLPVEERIDLDEVFTAGPKIPPALPQVVSEYATRVVVDIATHNATVAVVQGLGLPPPLGAGPTVATLDIDAFSGYHYAPESARVWEQLEQLHAVKNMAFFGSLHESFWRRYL
jgi:uncharacterized protein (TIGR04255 family)